MSLSVGSDKCLPNLLHLWCLPFFMVGTLKWFPGYGRLQSCVHPKPMGTSIKMEIMLSRKGRGERGRCNSNIWLMPDPTHSPLKPLASISPAAQGQVLWLAGAGCESGAARHCPCGSVAYRWQAMCSDSCIKGLSSFFSSSVCFWQHSVLQYCRWGKGSQHEKGGFKAIIFICRITKHRNGEAVTHWKHLEAVDFGQNLRSSTFFTRLPYFFKSHVCRLTINAGSNEINAIFSIIISLREAGKMSQNKWRLGIKFCIYIRNTKTNVSFFIVNQ